MYFDDPNDPNLENDYDNTDNNSVYSVDTFTTVNSTKHKHKKLLNEIKLQDKNYHSIKRVINKRVTKVELYSTGTTPTCFIRHAIYGDRYSNYRVGSRDEDMFFKVKIATCEKAFGNESATFFFDTPEQYEKQTGTIVSIDSKSKWQAKYAKELEKRR
jgi:hypothetical protein